MGCFYFISSCINILFTSQFCIIIVLVPTVTTVLLFKFHFNLYASITFQVLFSFQFCIIIVFYSCLYYFEVSETLIIGFVFISMLLFQINQTYPIMLDPII